MNDGKKRERIQGRLGTTGLRDEIYLFDIEETKKRTWGNFLRLKVDTRAKAASSWHEPKMSARLNPKEASPKKAGRFARGRRATFGQSAYDKTLVCHFRLPQPHAKLFRAVEDAAKLPEMPKEATLCSVPAVPVKIW